MMFFGGGMLLVMLLFLLVPLILIVLLAAGGYTLWRGVGTREAMTPEPQRYAAAPKQCATCGRPLQDDWTLCPYCGAEIV